MNEFKSVGGFMAKWADFLTDAVPSGPAWYLPVHPTGLDTDASGNVTLTFKIDPKVTTDPSRILSPVDAHFSLRPILPPKVGSMSDSPTLTVDQKDSLALIEQLRQQLADTTSNPIEQSLTEQLLETLSNVVTQGSGGVYQENIVSHTPTEAELNALPRLGSLSPEILSALVVGDTATPTTEDIPEHVLKKTPWDIVSAPPTGVDVPEGLPRTSYIPARSALESSIHSLVAIIETGPADSRLTEAQTALLRASELVASYVDSPNKREAESEMDWETVTAVKLTEEPIDPVSGLSIGHVAHRTVYIKDTNPPVTPTAEAVDYDKAAQIARTDKRVTPEIVDAAIGTQHYWHLEGTTTTICALVLRGAGRDGWVVVGTSGCYDPKNYNPAYGRSAAYGNARRKIFDFVAYKAHTDLRNEGLA